MRKSYIFIRPRPRHGVAKVLLVSLGLIVVAAAAIPRGKAEADCKDFASQAAAQAYLRASAPGTLHHLDEDNDGIACERLP